jgi:hypothetical protein
VIRAIVTMGLAWLAFDLAERLESECAIWSLEPGDMMCERCDYVAPEDVEMRDGTVERVMACQGEQ